MSAVRKGIIFIRQANKLAITEPKLLRTASSLILFGLLLIVFFLIPLLVIINFVDEGFWQMVLIGAVCAAFLYFCFACSHIVDLGTSCAFNALETFGTINLQECRKARRQGWQDALTYGFAYPLLTLTRWKPLKIRPAASQNSKYERAWSKAHFLLIPIMGIDDLNIRMAVKRIKEMSVKNLLRFNPKTVKARLISTTITWLVIAAGIALGVWLGMCIGKDPFASDLTRSLAAASGFLSAALIAIPVIAWQAFIRILLHTSAYRWMVSMQNEVDVNMSTSRQVPELLKRTLNS